MAEQQGGGPGESGLPQQGRKSRSPRGQTLSVLLAVLAVAAVAIAALILLLPPLLSPPPEPGPIYDLFEYGEVSAPLDPGVDRLLQTDDQQVALYVPVGAYAGSGTIVLQPRDLQFVPLRVEGSLERVRAVDLLIVDPQGNLVESPSFDVELLLCFKLTDEQQAFQEQDPQSIGIQHFDETALNWSDLATGPGWEHEQICATIDHFSMFALTVNYPEAEQTPTPTVGPKVGPTSTPAPVEIYTFPEANP